MTICQVGVGEANVSEPLMTRRKTRIAIETRWDWLTWDTARETPAYCPSDGRRKGGANPIQALVWNVGIYRSDAKGKLQVEEPQGRTY
jgi:hypothetical protein